MKQTPTPRTDDFDKRTRYETSMDAIFFASTLEREIAEMRAEREAELAELRAAISMTLETNGGPISSGDTIDGNEYVMVRMTAFQKLAAIDAAMKSP